MTVATEGGVAVCALDDVPVGGGVVALVEGHQVAIFRTADGGLYALDNRDPFTGRQVLGRGLLGDRDGRPYVASPLLKQRFDLATGGCLDDPTSSVEAYAVSIVDGRVAVALTPQPQ